MNDNDYDTHNPDNTPEDPTMEWNGEYPDQDDPSNYDDCGDDYDCEDDSWSDGDSLASAGWGMDEDYTGGCDW
mgnify:FL=1